MYKAIVYKDICTLRQKRLFFMWQLLVVIGAVALIKISSLGNGVDLFGKEFIHLFIISIASLGAFLELYMNFLLDGCCRSTKRLFCLIGLHESRFPSQPQRYPDLPHSAPTPSSLIKVPSSAVFFPSLPQQCSRK